MFTINIYLKFALIALGILGGIALIAAFGFWYGFPFLLMGILLLVSYFLLGTIQSASKFIEEGNFEAGRQRLELTKFPQWLYVTNRAMYNIMYGSIEASTGNNKGAEEYFQNALKLDLPSDNEKAMVLLQLANINATRNNWNGAMNYFNQAKKLNVTMPQIKEQVQMFDKALKNRGQAKLAQSMGGNKGGQVGMSSKRRRPKMR